MDIDCPTQSLGQFHGAIVIIMNLQKNIIHIWIIITKIGEKMANESWKLIIYICHRLQCAHCTVQTQGLRVCVSDGESDAIDVNHG